MATDAQIASLALTRIGHEGIATFSASGDKAQRWFFANYDFLRQTMIREHGWRFAIKRDVLTADTIHDITGATAASPVVITIAAGHSIANGSTVYIAGVIGMTEINNRTFTTAGATGTTLQLSGEVGTSHTAYVSGGSLTEYVANEFPYRFELPSDCLRILRINNAEVDEYRVEQGHIMTGESTCHVEYIFDQTDESKFDAQFVDLFAARLSAEICYYLTSSASLTDASWKIYNDKVMLGRGMDSRQGTPRGIDADVWLNARA